MAYNEAVLVADSSEERRREFGLALYKGGYEVINAVNGEEALRFTAGLNPTLVIAHSGLEGMDPVELCRRVKATGLNVPPMLILSDDGTVEIPDELEEDNFYALKTEEVNSEVFLYQVRLLLLARHVGGQLSDRIDRLYGDLTRIAIGDLLRVLLKFKITGHVTLTVAEETGLWFNEGEIVDAHWGAVGGRKAFNRIAGLRGGAFNLTLEDPTGERAIDEDLATLVTDAVDEKLKLDELFRRLPSLNSRLEVRMAGDFFTTEFSETQRAILTGIRESKNFADLIDKVDVTDIDVLEGVEALHQVGVVVFHEPEYRVHVVTDSTCDLHPSVVRRNAITVVPLSVIFGKKVFKDGVDILADDFYTMLRKSDKFPSTSPPGKGEFLDAYLRLVGSGDIISLHISSAQSLTFAHAREASEEGQGEFARLREESGSMRPPQVRVIDTRVNSVGLGMLVRFASRMARRGLGVEEIATRLESIADRMVFLFLVDTLEFLKKGGRIGGARAWFGTLLGIKPILAMENGEVQPVDKVRGGRKAHPKLVELMREKVSTETPLFAVIGHATAPKWAGRLRELVEKTFTIEECFEGEIGPIVGAHAGPGTVGCVLFAPEADELELLKAEE